MRLGRVVGGALIVLSLAAFAVAQPRGAKRKAAEDKARAMEKTADKPAERTDKPAERSDKPAERSDKPAERSERGDRADKAGESERTQKAVPENAGGAAATGDEGASELGEAPPSAPSVNVGESKLSPLTPEANEFPTGRVQPAPAEFAELLSDIAALRTRVSALTRTLFASKLKVVVAARGDDARIANLVVVLDEGVVYSAPERSVFTEGRTVYEHAVAPGYHVLGVNVERFAAVNGQYRTWQNSRFSVQVPEGKLTVAELVLDDYSEMAEDFPDDRDGEYDLRVRLRAHVED